MKKFLLYCAIFVLPFVVVLLPYFITDPFKVLYRYDNYYDTNGKDYYINTNRSFVSTQMYIQNKDKYHYDSFIFGSSRSGYFMVEDWKQYLPDSASCFHFDGYGESLYNVHMKLKFIEDKSPIRNAMFCFDHELLSQDKQDYGHLWVLPPCLVDDNFGAFHMAFIRAYLNPKFLRAYLEVLITGEAKPYMFDGGVFEKPLAVYKPIPNERHGDKRMLQNFPDSCYDEKSIVFPQQPDSITYGIPIIKKLQKLMLQKIHEILVRNHTDYKIIINPRYDQLLLAPEDKAFLMDLFGDNMIDFSGKNCITDDYHHYYDPSHFNEYIASEVMRIAYESDSVKQQNLLDSLYYK